MPTAPVRVAALRSAAEDLAKTPTPERERVQALVAEVLLTEAEQRSATVSDARVEKKAREGEVTDETCAVEGCKPLEVLRHGPRNERERAVISVLLALQVLHEWDGPDGQKRIPEMASGLDWLEFAGPYAPYAALRAIATPETRASIDAAFAAAPIEAPSEVARAAVVALRGGKDETTTVRDVVAPVFDVAFRASTPPKPITVAGELEGMHRTILGRTLAVLTGWAIVRGTVYWLLRLVFSYRRPVTISLDGEVLRVVGHSELLGRTLQTFDVRYPLAQLAEVRRETRYPGLPVAVSVVALGVGSFLGARRVVEGAGGTYFPLIAIGIGLIVGGLAFELLLRALFPGLRGATRLTVRATGARAVVLSELPTEEIDRLVTAFDRALGAAARAETPASPARREGPSSPPAERSQATG